MVSKIASLGLGLALAFLNSAGYSQNQPARVASAPPPAPAASAAHAAKHARVAVLVVNNPDEKLTFGQKTKRAALTVEAKLGVKRAQAKLAHDNAKIVYPPYVIGPGELERSCCASGAQ